MIIGQLPARNVVRISGINTAGIPLWIWRRALVQVGSRLQQFIRQSFGSERIAGFIHLIMYSAAWGLRKLNKGWDLRRGHQLNRIQRALGRESLFGITQIVGGTVTITFLEELLYLRVPHARWYAKAKVPGGRILVVNAAWLAYALAPLRRLELIAARRNARRLNAQRPFGLTFGRDLLSRRAGIRVRRRPLTLAQTAWRASILTSNRLRLLGR